MTEMGGVLSTSTAADLVLALPQLSLTVTATA
jgi:hypothetical protein